MVIDRVKFPALHKACVEVLREGNPNPPSEEFLQNYPFTVRENITEQDLLDANYALGQLSAEEFEEFCIGEEDNIKHLAKDSVALRIADNILDVMFNGGGL